MPSAWSTSLRQCCRYFKHKAWKVCFYMHATQQGYRTFVSQYTGCQKHEDPFYEGFPFIFFSHDYFYDPTMLLERKREREQKTDREERWKELSTVLKISLRWTGCLSKRNVCAGVMQISPNIRRRTAWQRQIIRGVRRCIPFMQIFMKFSWSGRVAARKVRVRCRVRLVLEVPKYAILIRCRLSGYTQLQTPSEAFSKMPFVSVIGFTDTLYVCLLLRDIHNNQDRRFTLLLFTNK